MRCPLVRGRQSPRRGMVLVMVLLCLTVLLAASALAVDGGALLLERRHAQETADAAALAAAADLYQHYPLNQGQDTGGTAAKSATTAASANGYTNDGTTSTVTVNIPPSAGPHAGKGGYAEVMVQYQVPMGLSAALWGSSTAPVAARAVARGLWVPASPQIIVFDLLQTAALGVGNNFGSISALGGPVIVNSQATPAANNPTSANFLAPSFQVTGTISGNFTGTKVTGSRPVPDPLSYLPPPGGLTVQQSTAQIYTNANPPPNPLPAGIYQGGIFVTGNVSLTLQPGGTYYIQGGGFWFLSYPDPVTGLGGTLTGAGVMIYNEPAGNSGFEEVYIDGNDYVDANPPAPGGITLSPLTSGPYQGITIFQARTAADQLVFNGNGSTNITGTIYAANANIQAVCESYGGHSDVLGTQFMARTVLFGGSSSLVFPTFPQPTHQRIVGLVE